MKISGFDLFVQSDKVPLIKDLGERISMQQVSNRGTPVWPGETPPIEQTNLQRCRFLGPKGTYLNVEEISEALLKISRAGFQWSMVHLLFCSDGDGTKSLYSG